MLSFSWKKKNLRQFVFLLGLDNYSGALENRKINFFLKKRNEIVEILGIIIGRGGRKINLDTLQRHLASKTQSSLLIKAVLFDRASFVFNGLVRIGKKIEEVNAFQRSQTLILSDKAHVEAKPFLEISADKAQCFHGTTISYLDKEQIFYLMSRGITEKKAEKLLIEGYLFEVSERIKNEEIKAEVKNKIELFISHAQRHQNLS